MSRMGIMGSLRRSPLSRVSFACVTRFPFTYLLLYRGKGSCANAPDVGCFNQSTTRNELSPQEHSWVSHISLYETWEQWFIGKGAGGKRQSLAKARGAQSNLRYPAFSSRVTERSRFCTISAVMSNSLI